MTFLYTIMRSTTEALKVFLITYDVDGLSRVMSCFSRLSSEDLRGRVISEITPALTNYMVAMPCSA